MGVTAGITMAVFGMQASANDAQAITAEGAYEANQMEFNARLRDEQAKDAIERGHRDASRVRTKTQKTIGAQRALLAAQGIQLDDGSALAVQEDTARTGELDAVTVKNNAWREAWGYKTESADLKSRADFTRIGAKHQAQNTFISGGLQAVQSGITLGAS